MNDWLINLLALAGAALVAYGLWLAYMPAGIVAAGMALVLAAIAITRANESDRRTH